MDIEQTYVPGSAEKKSAILLYFLIGIVVFLQRKALTSFEMQHLKQSLGLMVVFVLFVVVGVVFLFIPLLKWIPLLGLMILGGIWFFFVHQAWTGALQSSTFHDLFAGLGNWVLGVLDVSFDSKNDPEDTNDM